MTKLKISSFIVFIFMLFNCSLSGQEKLHVDGDALITPTADALFTANLNVLFTRRSTGGEFPDDIMEVIPTGDLSNMTSRRVNLGSSTNTWDNTYTNRILMGPGLSGSKLLLYQSGASSYGMGVTAGQFKFHISGSGARYAFYDSPLQNNEIFTIKGNGDVEINGTSVHSSDRNRKEDIEAIDNTTILKAIINMPIYEWQYKEQGRRHIGPMAQDFHKAFGLGDDDKSIASIDADGVALAAIKAQQEIIEDQQLELDKQNQKISNQQSEINTLKEKMAHFETLLIADQNK